MTLNMKDRFLHTSDNQEYVKTVGSMTEDPIRVMAMDEDQNHDFDFNHLPEKEGQPSKALILHAEAAFEDRISGTIRNPTAMMFIFDSRRRGGASSNASGGKSSTTAGTIADPLHRRRTGQNDA